MGQMGSPSEARSPRGGGGLLRGWVGGGSLSTAFPNYRLFTLPWEMALLFYFSFLLPIRIIVSIIVNIIL